MMPLFKPKTTRLAVTAALVILSQNANAWYCPVWEWDQSTTSATYGSLIPAIGMVGSLIVEKIANPVNPLSLLGTVSLGGTATTKAVEGAMKATITAASEQADAVYQKEGQRIITKAKAEAFKAYELAPNPCLTAGSALGAKAAKQVLDAKSSALLKAMIDTNNTSRNTSNALLKDFSNASKYMAKGSIASADKTLMDADILATSLLMGAGQAGKSKDYTFDKNSTDNKQELAARAFVNNAINTTPLPMLSPVLMSTDKGRQYMAMKRAQTAALSLPQFVFANNLAKNLKTPGLGASMGSHWASLGLSPDASPNEILKVSVDARASNPDWLSKMSTASRDATKKENVFIQSLYSKLQHEEIDSLNRIELLLAQQVLTGVASGSRHKDALKMYESAKNSR